MDRETKTVSNKTHKGIIMDITLVMAAREELKAANKALAEKRRDYVKQWVAGIVKKANLTSNADRLAWKTAPWGESLIKAITTGNLKLDDFQFTPNDLNLLKIHKLVVASPIK
jgi:hypothetical protein